MARPSHSRRGGRRASDRRPTGFARSFLLLREKLLHETFSVSLGTTPSIDTRARCVCAILHLRLRSIVPGAPCMELVGAGEPATPASTERNWSTARAGNHRFWLLSALHAHTKVQYENCLLRKTLRPRNRPARAGPNGWSPGRARRSRGHPRPPRSADARVSALSGTLGW